MASLKKQVTLRPTDEQFAQLTTALSKARMAGHTPTLSMNDFILGVVLANAEAIPQPLAPAPSAPKPIIFKPRSVVVTAIARDFTERSEPIPESAPDPFIERQFGSKLRQEFGSQHEFLIGQKRQGKAYRAMTNQQKYEYHVKMKQEVGE